MRSVLAIVFCLCAVARRHQQVTNLPQDQDKWYVSVVGDVNDPVSDHSWLVR